MLAKIVERYFAIPPQRKPSVFSKPIEGVDDLRGRGEFICEELTKLAREKKIFWKKSKIGDIFVLNEDVYILTLRKILSVSRLDNDTYLLDVFGKIEVGREINICGYSKPQDAFLPVVDLWDMVSEGKLRDVSLRHICGDVNFDPDKDFCPACSFRK